jgi:hypothetical protein
MIHGWRATGTALVIGLLLASATGTAQQPEPAEATDPIGWHEVQAGETLEGITAQYLGSPSAWRENWRLNPQISDPHSLTPGQRIRVILGRRTAEITAIAKDVDEKPYPEPWIPARLGDRLKERDGVRTRIRSSAELLFEDGSRLRIGEQSVVFLRDSGPRLEGVTRSSLEIQKGQADVEAQPASATHPDIEILIEGARAEARPGRDDRSLARARRSDDGTAQMMVFSGEAEMQAAGTTVALGAGMGTRVPKGDRPAAPEWLLPAPRPWRPFTGQSLDHANPKISWDPVDGASSYTLEVCRDPDCGQLVARLTELEQPDGTPDFLPLGELYWRVSAVSASGLDGYMSSPRPFAVRSLWRKPHPAKRR